MSIILAMYFENAWEKSPVDIEEAQMFPFRKDSVFLENIQYGCCGKRKELIK